MIALALWLGKLCAALSAVGAVMALFMAHGGAFGGWDAAMLLAAMQMAGAALFLLLITALLHAATEAAESLTLLRRQAEGREEQAARMARIAEAAATLRRQHPGWDAEHGEPLAAIARERLAEARVEGRPMRPEDALAFARHELRRRGQG